MRAEKLKKGDTIGIIAPSEPITEKHKEYMKKSIKIFEDMGFKIKLSKNIYKILQKGCVEGIIVGGNVPSMVTLLNTEYFPDLTDKILFLEIYASSTDFDLADRYIGVLKYHGVFDKIKGLWIGHYHGDTENTKIEDIFMRHLEEYDFPILKCDDFGHNCEKVVIPIGAKVRLDANNALVTILEE